MNVSDINKSLNEGDGIGPIKCSFEDYLKVDALSHSTLKLMKESPAKLRYEREHPSEPSRALQLGSLIHCALLEPDVFDSKYTLMPKFDRRTKKGKEGEAKWLEDNKGKEGVTPDMWSVVEKIHKTVWDDKFFSQFVMQGKAECSWFAVDAETGIRMRCRTDNWIEDKDVIVDIKTTENAQPWVFNSDITKYSYLTQAAYYTDMVTGIVGRQQSFVILAIEKGRDNDMAVYFIDKPELDLGRRMYRDWLRQYAHCVENDVWPGYHRVFNRYKAPEWLKSMYLEEGE